MAKRGGASWRRRETLDPAFQQAKKLGYRSRASLKLLEINQRAQLFKRGDWVLDLAFNPPAINRERRQRMAAVPTLSLRIGN